MKRRDAPQPMWAMRRLGAAAVLVVCIVTAGRASFASFLNWADATTNSPVIEPHGIARATAGLDAIREHLPAHGTIAYMTDRDSATVEAGERLLHVRNAAAPLVLVPDDAQSDRVLIDLAGDADTEQFCQRHALVLVAVGGDGLAVARRGEAP